MLINSLDEARRTVAASASLTLCMAKLISGGLSRRHSFL